MELWRERNKPTEIIATMAIFAGVDAVLSLLAAFFPFSTFFLMLAVPLTSVIIALVCPLKVLPLFIVAAFGVSLATTFWDFQTLLFYLLPSLIVGASFGFLERKGMPRIYTLFLTGIAELLLFLLTLFLVKGIYGVYMPDALLEAFGIQKNEYTHDVFFLFCWTYSLAQAFLVQLFVRLVLSKMKHQEKRLSEPRFLPYILGGVFLLATFIFVWFLPSVGYAALGFLFFWAIATTLDTIPQAKWPIYLSYIVSIFLSILAFGLFFRQCPKDTGLILSGVPAGLFLIINFINASLPRKKDGNKI